MARFMSESELLERIDLAVPVALREADITKRSGTGLHAMASLLGDYAHLLSEAATAIRRYQLNERFAGRNGEATSAIEAPCFRDEPDESQRANNPSKEQSE